MNDLVSRSFLENKIPGTTAVLIFVASLFTRAKRELRSIGGDHYGGRICLFLSWVSIGQSNNHATFHAYSPDSPTRPIRFSRQPLAPAAAICNRAPCIKS